MSGYQNPDPKVRAQVRKHDRDYWKRVKKVEDASAYTTTGKLKPKAPKSTVKVKSTGILKAGHDASKWLGKSMKNKKK